MKYFYSRVLSFVVSFSLVLSMVPAPAGAQTIAELEKLIADLQLQLLQLQNAYDGSSSSAGSLTTGSTAGSALTYGCVDLRSYPSMYRGSTDATTRGGVTLLQEFLARDASIYPEGIKSGYYGLLTQLAVERFQSKYGVAVLGSPGYGTVGPITKNKIYSLSCFSDVAVMPDTGTTEATDTSKPEVTIAQPSALSTVPYEGFTIRGSVTDRNGASDIAAVAVRISDTKAGTNLVREAVIDATTNYPTNGHPWSLNVPQSWINPGATLKLVVSATDKSGNQSLAVDRTIYVTSGAVLDFAAPKVSIGTPSAGATISYADGFLAQGSAEDGFDGVGVARVEVTITDSGTGKSNTGVAVLTSENTTYKRVAWKFPVPQAWISAGKSAAIVATAVDYNNHKASTNARTILVGPAPTTTVTPDATAPTLTIQIPSLSSATPLLSANGFYVNGTAVDNTGGSGVSKVEISVYDSGRAALSLQWTSVNFTGNEWAYTVKSGALTPGAKAKVSVRATDVAGNSSTKYIEATVAQVAVADTGVPVVYIDVPPTNGQTVSALNGIALQGHWTDDVGVTKITIVVSDLASGKTSEGIAVLQANKEWTYQIPASAVTAGGTVNVSALAYDAVGHMSTIVQRSMVVQGTQTAKSIFDLYDINGDGLINASDIQYVTDVGVGLRSCPSGKDCDLNNDGKVSATDADMIYTAIRTVYDFNSDGKLDGADVQIVADVGVGTRTCPAGKTCDFNRDGKVSATDATMVQNAINTLNATTSVPTTTITLLSPNGGEKWTRDSMQNIRWTPADNQSINGIEIFAYKEGSPQALYRLFNGFTNTGQQAWKVGSTFGEDLGPGLYRILVRSTSDISIKDSSDLAFEIVAPILTDTIVPTTVEVIDPIENQVVTYTQGFAMQVRAIDNTGGSGIKSVRASVLNTSTSAGDQYAMSLTGNNIWSVQIPQTKLTYGATLQLAAEAFDNAGNSKLTNPTYVTVEAAPAPTSPECSDGKNNDTEDALIDSADPGCRSTGDIDESNPAPVPTLFKINDRVVTTLNVVTRNIAGGNTTYGTKNIGDVGTVIGGPKFHRFDNIDYWWWNVKFDTGSSGWVIQNGIKLVPVVTADTTKPIVDITDPVPNQTIIKANGLAVQGTATDNHTGASGINYVKVSVFSSATNSAITQQVTLSTNNAWFAQLQPTQIAYGATLTISAQAVDKAGNPSLLDEVIVKVENAPVVNDTTKPTVTITDPKAVYPYPAYYANNFTVKGTAADTGGSGLSKVLVSIYNYATGAVTVNEGQATLSSGSWSYKVPASAVTVANKVHILAVAVDGSGNRSNTYEAQANILVNTTGKSPVWIYDISGDNIANQNDITFLNNVLVGSATCPTGKSCDFTGDFVVTNADKTKLVQLIRTMYDLDGNGSFNATDVQIVTNVAAGTRTCPTGKTCDFNQSGTVNATDANIANNALANMPLAASSDDAAALAALLASAQALLAQLVALMGQ